MKAAIFSVLMLGFVVVQAQTPLPPLDKSPMDMSYYPVNYPILKIQHKAEAPLIARVIYGRPQKNNRNRTDKIWLNKRSRMLMATAMIMNGG